MKREWITAAVSILLFLCSQPEGKCRFFSDNDQLSRSATGKINYDQVRSLSVCDGTDVRLLETPVKFPGLKKVHLETENQNLVYLEALSLNYSSISDLGISQRQH